MLIRPTAPNTTDVLMARLSLTTVQLALHSTLTSANVIGPTTYLDAPNLPV